MSMIKSSQNLPAKPVQLDLVEFIRQQKEKERAAGLTVSATLPTSH